ncbi:unnamed protein product, partial [Didymodactylos carnosus]
DLQNEIQSIRSSSTAEEELTMKLLNSQRDIENLNNLKSDLEQTIEQLNEKLKHNDENDQLFQKYILLTIDSLHIFRDNEENKIKVIREPHNADVYDLYTSELKRIEETDILYRNLKQSCEQVNFEHQELQKQFNDMKQRNEELEVSNEELKSELMIIKDEYRMTKSDYDQRAQDYRRQIKDFEEQLNSLQQEQQLQQELQQKQQIIITPSEETRRRSSDDLRLQATSYSTTNSNDNEEIVHDILQFIVNFVELLEKNNSTITPTPISNSSNLSSSASLLLSCDISTLLHSVGITNFTDELYLSNYEDVLRLCTLLIERCRVLQYALLRRNHSSDIFSSSLESLSVNDQFKSSSSVSLLDDPSSSLVVCSSSKESDYEQYYIVINRHHNKSLDAIFDQLLDWTISSTDDDHTRSSNENWKITISRPNVQDEKSQIRFELSTDAVTLVLTPKQIDNGVVTLRSEIEKLIIENEQQKDEIKLLEKQLSDNEPYEQLKTHQIFLEEQLDKQRAQTIELENVLKQELNNKTKYEEIQLSYNELEKKYLIAEELNEQLKALKVEYDELKFNLNQKDEQIVKDRCYLIERDEQIKVLSIELEQERLNTIELKQLIDELNTLKSNYEEMKQLKEHIEHELENLKNDMNDKDKKKTDDVKQQQFLIDLSEKKSLECDQLKDEIKLYITDLENVNKLLFEQTKSADDLGRQLQTININYENYKTKYEQMIHEQEKLLNDLNIYQHEKQLLVGKIRDYETRQNGMQDKQTDTDEFKRQEAHFQQTYDQLEKKFQINESKYSEIVKQTKNEIEQLQLKNNEMNENLSKLEENRLTREKEYQYRQNIEQITNEKLTLEKTVESLTKKLEENRLTMEKEYRQNIEQITNEKLTLEKTVESLTKKLEENRLTMEKEYRQNIEQITNEKLTLEETVESLTKKLREVTTSPPPPAEVSNGESIQELKEKLNKMKVLLTRLKKELQDKNQQPKQSLIDLELADYEKTIKYLKEEAQKKDKELSDLHEELNVHNDKYNCLKIEIDNLEQQKTQTEERANKFKTLLDEAKKELQNAKDLEMERINNEGNVRTLLDTNQLELDNNRLYINELVREKQQLLGTYISLSLYLYIIVIYLFSLDRINNNTDNSQRIISTLEQNLKILTHDLDIAKQDYDTLQDEFNSYKIRAQSVLKQQQQQQQQQQLLIQHENRLTPERQTEIHDLEETIEKLKVALKDTNEKLKAMMNENDALQKEQDRLINRQTKIVNDFKKREQELKTQIQKLENECLQHTNENLDMIKNVSTQNEMLSVAFKEQIASIQSDHERALGLVQSQLNSSRSEIEVLKSRLDYTTSRLDNNINEINSHSSVETITIGSNNDIRDDTNWFVHNTERQQGEGIDKELLQTTNSENSSTIAAKTLENVLFGNGDSANITNGSSSTVTALSSTSEKPKHILFEDVEMELQHINQEYEKCRLRLINITELLNDSELNNVRLEEQVNLLKDEIRRLERNMERADSISNLEYLKNVILKFFILRSTHERLQLIPVLVTMLKLSPDEQQKLVQVAHSNRFLEENTEPNQQQQPQEQQQNGGGNSWGSYLGKISGFY